ncbi:MAG: crossover junction endodeoxyribonuclease RuvC [Planctomycetota bacterium]
MRLIGIDPGTQTLGWGVIDVRGRTLTLVACGAHAAPKRAKSVAARLAAIADALAETVREHRPDVAAIERAFFGKNAAAALRVGEARGAALAELARAGVRVEELTPAEVKKALTGTGAARKAQVQMMVGAVLGRREPIEPLDASDAVAIAICLAHRLGPDGARVRSGRSARGAKRAKRAQKAKSAREKRAAP